MFSTVLDTSTGYPFVQMFYNSTQSLGATNAMAGVSYNRARRPVISWLTLNGLSSSWMLLVPSLLWPPRLVRWYATFALR